MSNTTSEINVYNFIPKWNVIGRNQESFKRTPIFIKLKLVVPLMSDNKSSKKLKDVLWKVISILSLQKNKREMSEF